jgi:hypothetical protein
MRGRWVPVLAAVGVVLLSGTRAAFAQVQGAPELDPGSLVSGLSLAVGVIALYLEGRRSR